MIVGYFKNVFFPSVFAAAQEWKPTNAVTDANALIKQVINLVLIIVVIAAVIFIMLAGVQYVTSQGDAGKAKQAMASITNAIIGLVVAFAAYAIVQLVMSQMGQEIQDVPTPAGGESVTTPIEYKGRFVR